MFEPDYSTALAWPWLHAKKHLSIELHQGKGSTYICPIFVQNRPRRCEKVGQVHVRSGAGSSSSGVNWRPGPLWPPSTSSPSIAAIQVSAKTTNDPKWKGTRLTNRGPKLIQIEGAKWGSLWRLRASGPQCRSSRWSYLKHISPTIKHENYSKLNCISMPKRAGGQV